MTLPIILLLLSAQFLSAIFYRPAFYVMLFIELQLFSGLVLFPFGFILCGLMTMREAWVYVPNTTPVQPWNDRVLYHWKARWMWIFDNKEDGLCPEWYRTEYRERGFKSNVFRWTAIRNYANNFRFVWGVSGVGRPIWKRTIGAHEYQAGWNNSGYLVLSRVT